MTKVIPFPGWTITEAVSSDASTRAYFRVSKSDKVAILMDCSGDPDSKIREFVKVAAWLRGGGLAGPEIYESDLVKGFLLLEDFGSVSFRRAIDSGGDKKFYYGLATDVLHETRAHNCDIGLPGYRDSKIHKGRRRVIDWYLPIVKQAKHPDGAVEAYLAAWDEIERGLPACPQGFLHADFHLENLMACEGAKGLAQCGLIDFQDAVIGPLPYDLLNLLEDARVDVPDDLRAAMTARYTEGFSPTEKEAFRAWYRVLATQFHCRVIGLFVRLAIVDGKTQYLVHIPRLERYIREALKEPLLRPLRAFFGEIGLDFSGVNDLNTRLSMEFIRPDAF